MSLDFVQEVQVKSSGYAAEFGGSTGGVINVITRSGSNDFHGDADDLLQQRRPERRRASDAPPPPDQQPRRRVRHAAEGRQASRRAGHRRRRSGAEGQAVVLRQLPAVASRRRRVRRSSATARPVMREQNDNTHYLSANATSQLTNSTRGKIAYNSAKRNIIGVLPGRAVPGENGTTAATALLDTNDIRPNWSLSGDYNWVVNDKFFLERQGRLLQAGPVQRGHPERDPLPLRPDDEHRSRRACPRASSARPTSRTSRPTAASRGTSSAAATSRWTAPTTATSPASHTIKGGVQFDRIANNVLDSEQQNLIRVKWNATLTGYGRGTFGYYQVRSNGVNPDQGFSVEGNIANTNVGLFIQDSWSVNDRLTLNLGLRTENESVPVLHDGGRHRAGRDRVGLRPEAGAAPRFRLRPRRRRQDEAVRQLGHLLRHLQAGVAAGLVRRPEVAGVLLRARHRRLARRSIPPAARRRARGGCSVVPSTCATRRTRSAKRRWTRTSSR